MITVNNEMNPPLEINPLENFFLCKKFERNKPPQNIFLIQECFLITYKSILIKWWDLYIDLSKWFINFRLILNILYNWKCFVKIKFIFNKFYFVEVVYKNRLLLS